MREGLPVGRVGLRGHGSVLLGTHRLTLEIGADEVHSLFTKRHV